jgi:hypothetical protein
MLLRCMSLVLYCWQIGGPTRRELMPCHGDVLAHLKQLVVSMLHDCRSRQLMCYRPPQGVLY